MENCSVAGCILRVLNKYGEDIPLTGLSDDALVNTTNALVMIFSNEYDSLEYKGSGILVMRQWVVTSQMSGGCNSMLMVLHNNRLHRVESILSGDNHGMSMLLVKGLDMVRLNTSSICAKHIGNIMYAIGLSPKQELQIGVGEFTGFMRTPLLKYIVTTVELPKGSVYGLFDQEGRLVGVSAMHGHGEMAMQVFVSLGSLIKRISLDHHGLS